MSMMFGYVAIPSADFVRAFSFYSTITGRDLQRNREAPFPMAYFIGRRGERVGHLFQLPGFKPSSDGPIVYVDVGDDIESTLALVEEAGGTTVMRKTAISSGAGFWAMFSDTEGNRLALHSSR